jgi:hypothetical protein
MSARHQHSTGEITAAARAILNQLNLSLGPLICPQCGAKALLTALSLVIDAVIGAGDRNLAEGVALTLERLASQCREMKPRKDAGKHKEGLN